MLIFTPAVATEEDYQRFFFSSIFHRYDHSLLKCCINKGSCNIFSNGLHLYSVAVVISGCSPRLGCRLSSLFLSLASLLDAPKCTQTFGNVALVLLRRLTKARAPFSVFASKQLHNTNRSSTYSPASALYSRLQ